MPKKPDALIFNNWLRDLKGWVNTQGDIVDDGGEGSAALKMREMLNSKSISDQAKIAEFLDETLLDALIKAFERNPVDPKVLDSTLEVFKLLKEIQPPLGLVPTPEQQAAADFIATHIDPISLAAAADKPALIRTALNDWKANKATLPFISQVTELFQTSLGDFQFNNMGNFEKSLYNLEQLSSNILQTQAQHAVYAQGFERLGLAIANLACTVIDAILAEHGIGEIKRSELNNSSMPNLMPMRA